MKTEDRPLREIVYNQIVEDIIRGRINAGEKLLEAELSKKFNVSRTPAREAIFQLEKDGYISHKKNVGAVVKKFSGEKIREIFDVVAQLEGHATERFVANGVKVDDISTLRGLQTIMENLAKNKNYIEYQNVNLNFHRFFMNMCGNQTLKEIVFDLRNKVYRLVNEGLSLPINIDQYLASHRKILQAISAGNAVRAGNLMKAHVHESADYLLKEMSCRDQQTI